ncbi:transporter substrate-binding domain-containing protein [Pseudomonas sp. 8Z]|uniref:substrate-binding periplasmic protein n=1 Tax=Pseudomonas sp. 8Z TaxID=2653166 RepID=UPI001358A5E5
MSARADALRLLTEDAAPLSFRRDGQLEGLSVAVVRALIARTGDDARIELMPWTRAIHLTENQADTGLFSTVRTAEREARFQWVGPILVGTTRFYSMKSRKLNISTLQDAAASGPLAVPKRWYTYEVLSSQGFSNLYGVSSARQMLTMLKFGRVNLIATEDLTLSYELASVGLRPDDLTEHLPLMRSAYYIAFSTRTDPARVARWRQALVAMHKDGSLGSIVHRWLPQASVPEPEP